MSGFPELIVRHDGRTFDVPGRRLGRTRSRFANTRPRPNGVYLGASSPVIISESNHVHYHRVCESESAWWGGA